MKSMFHLRRLLNDTRVLTIECKCYKNKVGVDDVADFAYKVRDIGAYKGIVVTTAGFES
jgi:restriction endonuclease Mrr